MPPEKSKDERNDIPEMNLDNNYSPNKSILPNHNELQKGMEKTRKELNKLKSIITKKYPFVQSIGLLPPQSIKLFIEEEEVPKETEKYMHLYIVIPEDKFKEAQKIKKES